jgi:D-serine deaminase-like pyridoxal phosphate-dependent protein
MPITIDQLATPALLLDLDVLEKNLQRMQNLATKNRVSLRPHIKTHKCIEIAKRQQTLGARGITVSTFYEAEQFAAVGFNDITWALPMPAVYAEKVIELANKITFRVVIDSVETKTVLLKAAALAKNPVHVWLKVDCGYHRAGVDPSSTYAEDLACSLSKSDAIQFDGILTHAGHSYFAHSMEEIVEIAEQERSLMVNFAQWLRGNNITVPAISVGSTPTATLAEKLDGVSEIRPGNYVFFDYMQTQLGVCNIGDCALTVLSSIISHQPEGTHFVTDAGALSLSKDAGATHLRNDMGMGTIYEDYERKRLFAHLDVQIQSLSQEHGIIKVDKHSSIEDRFKVGERVRILEHHSCLTVANFDYYYVVRGNEVVDKWKILRGRT